MNNIMDGRQVTIDGFKDFLIKTKTLKNANTLLESIFDTHIKLDERSELISDLILNLSEVFQLNGMQVLLYIQFNETLSSEDFGLNPKIHKNMIDSANKIKMKYGFIIRKLLMASQSPFLINSVETSIAANSTLHKIKFTRSDGESLVGVFNPEGLMSTVTGLTNALQASIEQGIYQLSDATLNGYKNQVNKLSICLNNLNQIRDKVAVTSINESNGVSPSLEEANSNKVAATLEKKDE